MPENPLPQFLRELAEQVPTRLPGGISGTDIKKIMAGEWIDLYLEKTGQITQQPLLELPPLIGKYLQPLHIAWFEWQTGRVVDDKEDLSVPDLIRAKEDFMPYATLDGRVEHPDNHRIGLPWEGKIVNGYMQREALIEREYPQLQWQCLCEDSPAVELSVLYLNTRWESMLVERDNDVIDQLMEQADRFWQHVINGTLPQDQVIAKVAPVKELVDMRGLAKWVDFEKQWLDNREPAKKFKDADAKLKTMIPSDAKNGFGLMVSFTRNKAGAVTLLPMPKEERDRLHGS